MKKLLYFDTLAGISGDMTIGALLDLGIDQREFLDYLKSLRLDGYQLKIKKKLSSHISCTDFDVVLDEGPERHHHRNLSDIHHIIDHSGIPSEAKTLSKQIFQTIGEAEAHIHQKTIDEIHFHEVGAIDSIIDIVGAAVAINMLNIDTIMASPLHLGTGTVKCAHGVLPVPAPATARILRGVPVYSTGVKGELVTPTGAAIIKNLSSSFGPLPRMIVDEVGYGSGKKDFGIVNLLRVFKGRGEIIGEAGKQIITVIETNIDDMNPELYSHLVPEMLEKGALDVYLTSITMKKGRPGAKLTVLCAPDRESEFEEYLLLETTTLGTRKYQVERNCLERKIITVDTPLGPVNVKEAYRDGKLIKSAPEYESCKKIAREKGVPINEVYWLANQRLKS